jgi:ubiquitin-activating enzyme E1 C
VPLAVPAGATLQDALDAMLADAALGPRLSAPSVSYGGANLYVRGALEAATAPNLDRPLAELLGAEGAALAAGKGVVLTVNDRKLVGPLRVRVRFAAAAAGEGGAGASGGAAEAMRH